MALVIQLVIGPGREPPQGLWMPGSIRELETLILERRIRRSPVLISAMMSAVAATDAFDNVWFEKRKAVNRIGRPTMPAPTSSACTA